MNRTTEADQRSARDSQDTESKSNLESYDLNQSESKANPDHSLNRGRRCGPHFKRFWWVYLLVLVFILLLVTLIVIFVALPRIAQRDVNRARLTEITQELTNPTPDNINLALGAVVENPSAFTPVLDSFNASLYLPDAGPGRPFGYVTVPRIHATSRVPIMINQTMEIVDMEQFTAYNIRALNQETYEVGISGTTGLKLGGLPKNNVNFTKIVEVRGLNGLRGLEVVDISISVPSLEDGTNTNGTAYIPNDSNITVAMGNVTFDLDIGDTSIGAVYLDNISLTPGDNWWPLRSTLNQSAVLTLIATQYTDGILPVSIIGNSSIYNGQVIPYFTSALESDTINVDIDPTGALEDIGINATALSELTL